MFQDSYCEESITLRNERRRLFSLDRDDLQISRIDSLRASSNNNVFSKYFKNLFTAHFPLRYGRAAMKICKVDFEGMEG